jgi:hypothetical protein
MYVLCKTSANKMIKKISATQMIKLLLVALDAPVWKVCIARRISLARNFDAFYIFTITFSKSPACNFQTFLT